MLQQSYVSGFERATFSAFGVNLQPLTLGHVSVLALIESPMLSVSPGRGESSVTAGDLASVVFVCAHPRWEDALQAIRSGNMAEGAQKYIEEAGDKIDLQVASDTIRAYYEYYMSTPEHKSRPTLARVPWWWAYATWLQANLGWPERKAWGTICSDAFAYHAAHITNCGSEDIMDMEQVRRAEMVKQGKTYKQMFKEGLL